jgi:hypothetical protein
MKRTSLWLVLLAFTPGISEAWGYGSCCGVRYTPYAFTYRHSGLVSACVDYTPYAFTYRNSGLVPGYGTCSGSSGDYGYTAGNVRFGRSFHGGPHGGRSMPRHAQDTAQSTRPQDGRDIIRGHLLAKGIQSASVNRILMIDNQLVSADFVLKDRNLLIKYWNPEAIKALNTQEGSRQQAYENYRTNWAKVAAQHEQNGGQIYTVEASDAQTIVAALDACTTLDTNPQAEGRTVLYARN